MRNKLKILAIALLVIILAIATYLFLWGKLFPLSPIIIGFSKYELSNTIVYIQDGFIYDDYKKFDLLTPSVEKFHDLKFVRKPKIFIFHDKESYLQRSISSSRFFTYPNGDILISPWGLQEAEEGKISLEIYLNHELSHSILFQNMGFLMAFKYPQWLLEGIAMYSANQMGTSFYPSKEETYNLIRQGNFIPPEYYKTDKEKTVNLNIENKIAFMYSEFACIVDYLIETAGKDKFLYYMKELIKNDNHEKIFKSVYDIDFDDFIKNFKEQIMKNSL
jgi:hypothetical protein